MTFTWKRGGFILKFVTCLQIIFLKSKWSIVHFCGWRGWWVGVTILVIFGGRHKYISPKWFKITTNSIKEAIASYSASSQIHFDCIENNLQHPFPLPIAPLPPFHWSSNQKNLLISVGIKFFTRKNVVTY